VLIWRLLGPDDYGILALSSATVVSRSLHGLLDQTEEHPASKLRRYLITILVFVLLAGGGLWWLLRYHTEKTAVYHF